MADELQVQFGITYANGNLKDKVDSSTIKITQTTRIKFCPSVTVGTSEEDLAVGDITAANGCWAYLFNCDSTNFVKYGPKAAGVMVEYGRLYAGKGAWVFLAPAVVHRWIADTAPVLVDVRLYEK